MPVYILKEEMPYNELLRWIEFFHKRPIGWQEDQRTYLLLKAQGVKESGENLFPSLKAIKENTNNQKTQISKNISIEIQNELVHLLQNLKLTNNLLQNFDLA